MKKPHLLGYIPLFVITIFSFGIKLYDPLRSPVLAALDPWGWVLQARQFLLTGKLDTFFIQTGYPPTFLYLIAGLATFFHSDPYDIVRYVPVLSALNVIPTYLLAFEVFRSHRVAALSSVLAITSRFYFMRTSIGNPESLAHFFFVFSLLFLLRTVSFPSWKRRLLGAASITASVLYYHFTVLILIPFLVVLPFILWSRRKDVLRETAFLTVPAFLFSGLVWYFQVLPNMIHSYLGITRGTYARPTFENSFLGLARVLIYSVGKSGAVALSEMGYVVGLIAILGFTYILTRQLKRETGLATRFLVAYLLVIAALVLASRIIYSSGIAIAGDISVYFFSWLTVPASILAAATVIRGLNHSGVVLQTRFRLKDFSRYMKVLTICIIVLLCWINLNSFNYYKAPSGGGLIPDSFYYYKPMTDQEYYALAYIRDNTPTNAQIIVVGVEHTILEEQAVVARRAVVGITNMTIVNQTIEFSGQIVFPDTHYENITSGKIQENGPSTGQVYVVTGIRYVSIDIARIHGSPPATIVLNEQLLTGQLAGSTAYHTFYQNDQITVGQVPLQIQY